MVEHGTGDVVATFFSSEPLAAGARQAALGEGEAHHVRVRRLAVGARIRLTDGAGAIALGTLIKLGKHQALVEIDEVRRVEPLPAIHLLAPIADRERMLWLAEKVTELGIASWRPVLWKRSRSVSPRGEGLGFQEKVRARMIAALTQSGGAWLPTLFPDAPLERAIAAAPPATRLLLDAAGDTLHAAPLGTPVTIALGPEGGIEDSEREHLVAANFRPVRLAPLTLRFETAGIVACGAVRAALEHRDSAIATRDSASRKPSPDGRVPSSAQQLQR